MRFIHVSDVHLGMIPDKGKPWSDVRAKEIEETFDRILDNAEERKVDLLLIAGNLYHSAPKAADLAKLDARLAKLTNTRTVIIAGSSDYIESGSRRIMSSHRTQCFFRLGSSAMRILKI